MVVAVIALIAATAGTALAATGQLVNIVDPATSSYAARVDSAGQLKVVATGAVKVTPSTAFSRSVYVPNYYASPTNALLLQTSATVAIGRIQLSVEDPGSSPWDGAIWYQPADAAGVCNGTLTRIAVEAAEPGTTHLDQMAPPITLKPAVAGRQWCLKASFGPLDGSSDGNAYVDVSGTVLSGTVSPVNAVAQSASRAASPTGR